MTDYLKKYRPFLLFLVKFLTTYLVLLLVYQYYLSQFDVAHFQTDSFTASVALQVQDFLKFFDYNASLQAHLTEASVRIFVDNQSVVRIVEGCNALSVMILFVAFIVAFAGKFWQTLGYILAGILLIHVLNVVRISLLIIGILTFKPIEHILHDVVFPLFIYGIVFGLWVFWVTKFSNHATKNP